MEGPENKGKGVERVKGIEPSWPVWKTGALPLSYTRNGKHINARACVVNSRACMVLAHEFSPAPGRTGDRPGLKARFRGGCAARGRADRGRGTGRRGAGASGCGTGGCVRVGG